MPQSKLRIIILYGGRSAEHDVSVLSATNVMRALELTKYDPVPVFVTRDGRWILAEVVNGSLTRPEFGPQLCLIPGGQGRGLAISDNGTAAEFAKIDILFPVLHGLHGEDGSVQGMAEVARVPLVGCSILGSANALDKDVAKRLLHAAGIPVARAVTIHEQSRPTLQSLEAELGWPVFIKPARQGSSVGVRKVSGEQEFGPAMEEAFRHDSKLLAEESVVGREIEFAILENADGEIFVSRAGEIVPADHHGFYSYDAKYIDENGAALRVPAELPADIETAMRQTAVQAFKALGCDGMARVDFFLTEDMHFLVNELNTIPGFTDISMYSKVMAASGVDYAEIIDRLVAHGLARAARPN